MNQCHLQQHGWTQRILYLLKSDKERQVSYITSMWNINELTYKSETDPQTFKGRRDKLSILDLIYISMIASIVEHIFSCAYQLTIYVFSLEKYVFQSFAHFCSVYFVIDGVVVLYTLWISVLMRCIVFIYFLFFLWLAFCLWFKIFLLKYSISLNLNCI